MSDLVKKVQEEGYYYTDWNVDSIDASGNGISADRILSSVKNGCKKKQYNIVLMHDSNAKKTTAEALPKIIEWARKDTPLLPWKKADRPYIMELTTNNELLSMGIINEEI